MHLQIYRTPYFWANCWFTIFKLFLMVKNHNIWIFSLNVLINHFLHPQRNLQSTLDFVDTFPGNVWVEKKIDVKNFIPRCLLLPQTQIKPEKKLVAGPFKLKPPTLGEAAFMAFEKDKNGQTHFHRIWIICSLTV